MLFIFVYLPKLAVNDEGVQSCVSEMSVFSFFFFSFDSLEFCNLCAKRLGFRGVAIINLNGTDVYCFAALNEAYHNIIPGIAKNP